MSPTSGTLSQRRQEILLRFVFETYHYLFAVVHGVSLLEIISQKKTKIDQGRMHKKCIKEKKNLEREDR